MSKKMSNDEILEVSCVYYRCTNYREPGYIYCTSHLYGRPKKLPLGLAKRKLELDASMKGAADD